MMIIVRIKLNTSTTTTTTTPINYNQNKNHLDIVLRVPVRVHENARVCGRQVDPQTCGAGEHIH